MYYEDALDVGYLTALCSSVGAFQEDENSNPVYVKHEQCLETLQDLMRFLRRDDPVTREAFMLLGKWNIVHTDLLPLLQAYHSEPELVIHTTKLLVYITLPIDPESDNQAEQQRMLQRIKSAFLDGDTSAVVVSLIAEPLARFEENGRMSEADTRLVQLVLTLFRNLLFLPDVNFSMASAGNHLGSLQNQLLKRFFAESVMEVLLLIAQDANRAPFVEDNALLVEIFHEIFKGQVSTNLAHLAQEEAEAQAQKESERGSEQPKLRKPKGDPKLAALLAAESQVGLPPSSRHSRFGGVYSRQSKYDEGRKTIIRSNPLATDDEIAAHKLVSKHSGYGGLCFGRSRPKLMTKNRLQAEQHLVACGEDVRRQLRDLLEQFLAGPYNKLMGQVVSDISNERHRGLSANEALLRKQHFMHLGKFCLSYMRHSNRFDAPAETESGTFKDSPFAAVSETVDQRTFHMVRMQWFVWSTEKNVGAQALASGMLKEMLHVLHAAQEHGTEMDGRVAYQLALAILADETDESLLRMMHAAIKTFQPHKQPRSHLVDAVEGVHVVLQLLESLDRRHNGNLQVRRKATRKAKKKGKDVLGDDKDNAQKEGAEGGGEDGAEDAGGISAEVDEAEEAALVEEDDMDARPREQEQTMNLQNAYMKLLDSQTVNNYCWVLKDYQSNGKSLNHCIVYFLHRLQSFNLHPMMYQLSVLRVFQRILSESGDSKHPDLDELVHFSRSFVRGFFQVLVPSEESLARLDPETRKGREAAANMMFVEVLFWSSRNRAMAIAEDIEFDASFKPMPVNERGFRKKPQEAKGLRSNRLFSLEDDEEIVLLFAQHEAERNCLDQLVEGMDDRFTSDQIKRRMAFLGLRPRHAKGSGSWAGSGFRGSRLKQGGGGDRQPRRRKNIPKRGAAHLFEEGPADEEISESEDEPSDTEVDGDARARNVEAVGMGGGVGCVDGRRSREEERAQEERGDVGARGDTSRISTALIKINEHGLAPLDESLQWVDKQLQSARELWIAMSKHNRSTLDDFSLVPTTDADWDMLDCSAVEELLQALDVRPPAHGHMFWRIPGVWGATGLDEAIADLHSAAGNFGCTLSCPNTDPPHATDTEQDTVQPPKSADREDTPNEAQDDQALITEEATIVDSAQMAKPMTLEMDEMMTLDPVADSDPEDVCESFVKRVRRSKRELEREDSFEMQRSPIKRRNVVLIDSDEE